MPEVVDEEDELEYKATAVEVAANLDVPSDLLDFGFDTPAPTSASAAIIPAQTVI